MRELVVFLDLDQVCYVIISAKECDNLCGGLSYEEDALSR